MCVMLSSPLATAWGDQPCSVSPALLFVRETALMKIMKLFFPCKVAGYHVLGYCVAFKAH